MKIALGSDHGGLDYKNELVKFLNEKGIETIDCGTYSLDSCHYPEFAHQVAYKVKNKEVDFGVVVCTSGEGVCMVANKVHGVRCGIGYNDEVCALMRQHNHANVISFSQKFMDLEDVKRRIMIFLNTPEEGGRHQSRVDMISSLED